MTQHNAQFGAAAGAGAAAIVVDAKAAAPLDLKAQGFDVEPVYRFDQDQFLMGIRKVLSRSFDEVVQSFLRDAKGSSEQLEILLKRLNHHINEHGHSHKPLIAKANDCFRALDAKSKSAIPLSGQEYFLLAILKTLLEGKQGLPELKEAAKTYPGAKFHLSRAIRIECAGKPDGEAVENEVVAQQFLADAIAANNIQALLAAAHAELGRPDPLDDNAVRAAPRAVSAENKARALSYFHRAMAAGSAVAPYEIALLKRQSVAVDGKAAEAAKTTGAAGATGATGAAEAAKIAKAAKIAEAAKTEEAGDYYALAAGRGCLPALFALGELAEQQGLPEKAAAYYRSWGEFLDLPLAGGIESEGLGSEQRACLERFGSLHERNQQNVEVFYHFMVCNFIGPQKISIADAGFRAFSAELHQHAWPRFEESPSLIAALLELEPEETRMKLFVYFPESITDLMMQCFARFAERRNELLSPVVRNVLLGQEPVVPRAAAAAAPTSAPLLPPDLVRIVTGYAVTLFDISAYQSSIAAAKQREKVEYALEHSENDRFVAAPAV